MVSTVNVYLGRCVTKRDTQLTPLSLQSLYEKIREPDDGFLKTIERLRTLQTINTAAYRDEKKQLPFFTCGSFVPPVRHSANFGSISCLVLDIDHLSEKELTPEIAKERLKKDHRVAMAFLSPGSDGLKVLVVLAEPCYDASLFSLFYRQFAVAFAREHEFEQVLDKRTSDVTRACFLSYDPDAWYNPDAVPVNLREWVDVNNELSLSEQIHQQEVNETLSQPEEDAEPKGPDSDALAMIKSKLNPSARPEPQKKVYVPEQLRPVTEEIARRAEEFHLTLAEVKNIQYGRKLKFMTGHLWAELNVFYGKKGFSVVATPKRGSNQELADLAREVVFRIISEMETAQISNTFQIPGDE